MTKSDMSVIIWWHDYIMAEMNECACRVEVGSMGVRGCVRGVIWGVGVRIGRDAMRWVTRWVATSDKHVTFDKRKNSLERNTRPCAWCGRETFSDWSRGVPQSEALPLPGLVGTSEGSGGQAWLQLQSISGKITYKINKRFSNRAWNILRLLPHQLEAFPITAR